MKIIALRKKIIISFSISGILVAGLGAILFYDNFKKKSSRQTIDKIISKTTEIKAQSSELKTKAIEIKKYIRMWNSIHSRKKITAGINKTMVEADLKRIARKHYISLPELTISDSSRITGGSFKSTTINTSLSTVSLTFKAINDLKALLFIDEFIDSIPGYKVISNFEVDKQAVYTIDDLISLTSGESSGKIAAKIDFFWYAFENKETPSNETK